MSKVLELKDDLKSFSDDTLISIIGSILNVATDVAYAYEIDEEMAERLKEVFDDMDIESEIVEDEF